MNYKIVDHEIGVDFWHSKRELFEAFFGKFYEFIHENYGDEEFLKHDIKKVQDFYDFASWSAGGMENCYAMGFAFNKYFMKPCIGSKMDDQPETVFLGYCHKNHIFDDFLDFLVTYFAWWRNDEGCTRFNPYNFGDDFFASSWAVLVDTCKLFWFTGETVFHWQSFRIKYVCDNIPGVILKEASSTSERMRVAGYEFMGWEIKDNMPYAKFIRKDHYNYWEKEEPKLVKVITPESKIGDPE